MKKIKLIKKLTCLTLIGGGILVTLPLTISSCSKTEEGLKIIKVEVDNIGIFEGTREVGGHQSSHIQVFSSDYTTHEYGYEVVDASPTIAGKVHVIRSDETGYYYVK
jgi:hypothetical protein